MDIVYILDFTLFTSLQLAFSHWHLAFTRLFKLTASG